MWLVLDLKFKGLKGQTVIHVSPESGPLCHPLDGAFLSCEDASHLLQLLLIPLKITDALSLQQAELLMPVLIHGDVFAHVGVEAEISARREEGVKHGVNLLSVCGAADDIVKFGFEACVGGAVLAMSCKAART